LLAGWMRARRTARRRSRRRSPSSRRTASKHLQARVGLRDPKRRYSQRTVDLYRRRLDAQCSMRRA
jgi:hypothetical protein